jgi:peptide/nickel transport system substrate-binding protein
MKKFFLFIACLAVMVPLALAPSFAQMKYKESPMLSELVRAGKLPPVEERLPKVPGMVRDVPKEDVNLEIGRYGGTIRTVTSEATFNPYTFCMSNEPLLRGPGLLGDDTQGNVLQDYRVSPDGKVFTFTMREGMKWSDGAPVTSEDVLFAYEDVLLNKEITPVFPAWLRVGGRGSGEPMKLEVIDKYTFRISFAEPYGGFPVQLGIVGWKGYSELLKPKHFLKQFHTRYTPLERLEPLIQKEALAKGEWWTLFNKKDVLNWELTGPAAIGFPVLYPWVIVEYQAAVARYERNPYYWKVDAAGNQLPYVDRLRSEVVADEKVNTLKIISGEVDFRTDGGLTDLPIYRQNAQKGGYQVLLLDMHRTYADVNLNLTNPDPVWRQVVRDVRFRRALNMSINRQEIIDAVYYGFASLPQTVPSDYDPDRANQLLDEMGLSRRDAEGFRLGPDGKTFVIPFEINAPRPDIIPVSEMVVEYFKAVGVKTTMKVIEGGLWSTRNSANELKATVFWEHYPPLWWGAIWDVVPVRWGPLWWQWINSGGKQGEEPPAEVKRIVELIQKALVSPPEERQGIVNEFTRLQRENIFIMVTAEKHKDSVIANKKLGNVPHKGFGISALFSGEQFFYKQ